MFARSAATLSTSSAPIARPKSSSTISLALQRAKAQGVPPRPRGGAVNTGQSGMAMDESFDKEAEGASRAYEARLKRLEGETREVLGETDFLEEKLKIEEEERKFERVIEEERKPEISITPNIDQND